ncbi:MAG: type II secretion system protein GspN [Spirochaetota bacterium]|nr:type II secretion system protein GspN [Spirochaetota bacterium]
MDIKDLQTFIRNILKKSKKILKEAVSLPYAKLYILLSIILILFFMILTFPYEALIRNSLQTLESTACRSLYIGNIDFSLTNNTNIDNISFILKNGAKLNFDDIDFNISLNPFTTLMNKNLKGNMIIKKLGYAQKKISIDSNLESNFDLIFKSMSDFPTKGYIKLDFKRLSLGGLNIKGFDIPPISFSSMKIDTKITGKRIGIQDVTFSGKDINGKLNGFITPARRFKNSKIDLKIMVDPASPLLDNYKVLLGNIINSEENIRISLRGTISNPRVDFPKRD